MQNCLFFLEYRELKDIKVYKETFACLNRLILSA